VSLFVDTSVWSLALRRDRQTEIAHVGELRRALEHGQAVITTGLVLQELLQSFAGPKSQEQILNSCPLPQALRASGAIIASRTIVASVATAMRFSVRNRRRTRRFHDRKDDHAAGELKQWAAC